MEDDIRNLLDLCRLNLLEEHIKDSPAIDKDATLRVLDWKRRELMTRIPPATLLSDLPQREAQRRGRGRPR